MVRLVIAIALGAVTLVSCQTAGTRRGLTGDWFTGWNTCGTSLSLKERNGIIEGEGNYWSDVLDESDRNEFTIRGKLKDDKVTMTYVSKDGDENTLYYIWRDDILVSIEEDWAGQQIWGRRVLFRTLDNVRDWERVYMGHE
jgi:hypothetical protein